MALDVSTGFAAPRLALMRSLSCSSFRLPLQAGWPMARHVRVCREHTSEERLSGPARYSHRGPWLSRTPLRDAVLTGL
jgi:hypothetical protein